jgi:hypothetical protein
MVIQDWTKQDIREDNTIRHNRRQCKTGQSLHLRSVFVGVVLEMLSRRGLRGERRGEERRERIEERIEEKRE